jgi:hypothetical protein
MMSGTPPNPAPQRVIPPLADQPIANQDGRPSNPMVQWMQRLSALVGSVPPSASGGINGGGNLSITQQITNLNTAVNDLIAGNIPPDFSLAGQIDALKQQIRQLLFIQQPPPAAADTLAFEQRDTGIVYLANGTKIIDGYGDPNGIYNGRVGDLFLQRDGSAVLGVIWEKTSGDDTSGGWTNPAGGGPPGTSGIYAPLVNGDLPGPTLIADPLGQCVMVEIT